MSSHGGNSTVGNVDTSRFDPSEFVRDFYRGDERKEGGRTVREYEFDASNEVYAVNSVALYATDLLVSV